MQTATEKRKANLHFTFLPSFAKFLLDNHLHEFVKEQLRLSRELELPALKYFTSLSEEELIAFSTKSATDYLNYLVADKAGQQIEDTKQRWLKDQLQGVARDQVAAEDITGASYMRKQAFLAFVPIFTPDVRQIIELVKEIDQYIFISESVLMDTYISLLDSRIQEHSHFIKRITETTPGIIYVYDPVAHKHIYVNKSVYEHLGYASAEVQELGPEFIGSLVHPEDQGHVLKYDEAFRTAEDGEIRTVKYRIRTKDGVYRWLRAYESVFRRDENGNIRERIGVAIDIHNEQIFADKLRASEEQLLEAQALAHIGNWVWQLDTNQLEWSNELYAMHGLDPNDGPVTFEQVSRLVHPADLEKNQSIMSHSRKTLEPYDFYYRIILDDGAIKTLHAKGEVLTNENNQPYKMIGTLQDVTERQNLIDRLQLSDEMYKQAQAISHIGNWTWLIKEDKILWSDELFRIYGLEPQSQQISFEHFASFIHPDDKEFLFNTIQGSLLSKQPYELQHRIILKDGTVKYLEAKGHVQLSANGQPERMLGIGQDVTERVLIEQKARESQHFIRKIADAIPAIIASYNINTGEYKFVSLGLKKLLGYEPDQPLKQGVQFFIDIIHPDDFGPIMEKNAIAVQTANEAGFADKGEPIVEFEYRMRHANGEYRWFHSFGTIFDRNGQGRVEHVLNISIDTTERKEMETALTLKNIELQQSNANLEEFAYVASHDLKEPLRKISIFGDRLLSTQQEQLGPDGQFYLEKIIDSSRRMQALINDLLSLSLIAGNKSFVNYSLQLVLEEVMRTLEYKIEEKGAVIKADPLPEAKIIPSQFRQLFQNLLTNSLKFVPDGKQPLITVTHRLLRFKDVEKYNLARSRTYVEICFADNGIGFDNMFASKIFAIFQRLQHKDYEGTGIGLAICKKIVENHGGVIFASGKPDAGATFTFIIPV